MTYNIAIIGKSGSGKTTITRCLHKFLRTNFKESTVLLVDNDLTLELSQSYDINTKNTLYGIKSGKHEYKTGIPDGMSKQEYIDWAIEDIIVSIDENTDIIASWFVTPKDCTCISTKLMRDALSKFIDRYDYVIFDCEYDLKYLNSLLDCKIDEAVIVSLSDEDSIELIRKIEASSRKYIPQGQLDIILNKIKKEKLNEISKSLSEYRILGFIEQFEDFHSDMIAGLIENFHTRMNLPQI